MLDTNICIYFLKGQFNIDKKLKSVGVENCFISEITVAELKFGAENSVQKEKNRKVIENFIDSIQILPIISCLDTYAKEKARLRKKGLTIDEFDLLIGSSSIENNMVLVTRNVKHFSRLKNCTIENWIDK
ncbi:MAG: type II toxin-antitoxin system VapC family toxin [Bacteroidales bacterium]